MDGVYYRWSVIPSLPLTLEEEGALYGLLQFGGMRKERRTGWIETEQLIWFIFFHNLFITSSLLFANLESDSRFTFYGQGSRRLVT
jgi:hypothetical protein